MSHTIDGNQIDTDDPLAVAVISGGSTAHTLDGNLIDEDHPLAVAVVSGGGGGGSMTAPEIAAAGGMAVVAYKSVDETVNNSDVLQDDDALFFAVGANEVWRVHVFLNLENVSTSFDFKWTGPALAAMRWQQGGVIYGSSPVDSLSIADESNVFGTGFAAGFQAVLDGVYTGGANAGTLQLQWAQSSADPSDNKVLAGSHILAARLA